MVIGLISLNAFAEPPQQDTRTVALTEVYDGQCAKELQGISLKVFYDYDFAKTHGYAKTISLGNAMVDIMLHPIGVKGKYMFVSDTKPLPVTINGIDTYVYRVIFTLYPNGNVDGMVLLGKKGECTITSPWPEQS